MLPLLFAAAALAGAAYCAWQLRQQMGKGQGRGSGPGNKPGRDPGHGASKSPAEREPARPMDRNEKLLHQIVDSIRFTMKQMVVGMKKVGEEERISPIPADTINVRPMRSMSEIPAALSSTQALDDDVFYGQVASNSLPVVENIERVDLTEPEMGKARNVLLVLQDCSGSMREDGKDRWSLKLNQLLMQKCIEQEAEYILIPFTAVVHEIIHRRTADEIRQLSYDIPNLLGFGGGTTIQDSLIRAIEYLVTEKFAEARILLVTDGEDGVSRSYLLDQLHKANVTLHSVCIGSQINEDLKAISDDFDWFNTRREG